MSIRPRQRTETQMNEAKAYDTILRPIITEKSTMLSENNQDWFCCSTRSYQARN